MIAGKQLSRNADQPSELPHKLVVLYLKSVEKAVEMPIYEYQCADCGAEFQDLVMSRAAEVEVTCKSCSSSNVSRLLSTSAVRSAASSAGSAPLPMPRSGGCGGGCACH